ncbi:FAD-dependent oxidoreductase [Pantoea sp. B65]|uniref:FAD-dependent oxidoreductase n=1 Tax=Pantoea sp. B65 TaxID=2813359 RepID=UPI0039B6229B
MQIHPFQPDYLHVTTDGPSPTKHQRSSAIVIGAGVAGLMAARVLCNHFPRVYVIEQDQLPATPQARKGVPQARHVHLLMVRGRQVLDHFFPQLTAELFDLGAMPLDWYADVRWFGPAGWMAAGGEGLITCSTSRDLLEFVLRRRVVADSRVELISQHKVVGLQVDAQTGQICGVEMMASSTAIAARQRLAADLVIDASGRGSRSAKWLDQLGYGLAETRTVNAFLGYSSRLCRLPAGASSPPWKALIVSAHPPDCFRAGGIFAIEHNQWMVVLMGGGGDYPPKDEAGFVNFARSLRSAELYQALTAAEPVSPIYHFRRTENRWIHYERQAKWPAGLMVMGDAVCGFNPIYGQGMTVALLSAELLDRVLDSQAALADLTAAFRQQLAALCAWPWTMATGADLLYPTTEGGESTWYDRLAQHYLDQVLIMATKSPDIYRRFVRVMNMVDPPSALFAPAVAARMAIGWLRN